MALFCGIIAFRKAVDQDDQGQQPVFMMGRLQESSA